MAPAPARARRPDRSPARVAFVVGSVGIHLAAFVAVGILDAPVMHAATSAPTWVSFDLAEPEPEPVVEPEPEPEPVVEPEPEPEPVATPEPVRAPEPVEPEPESQPEPEPAVASQEEPPADAEPAPPSPSQGIASHEGGMATDLPAAPAGGGTGPISHDPVVAEPAPPRPPPRAVDVRALVRGWIADVSRLLAARAGEDYPRAARRAGLEGRVLLSLVVDERGRILRVAISRSSGHDTLDEAAVALVHGIGAIPAPPAALRWEPRPLTVPIAYRLH